MGDLKGIYFFKGKYFLNFSTFLFFLVLNFNDWEFAASKHITSSVSQVV